MSRAKRFSKVRTSVKRVVAFAGHKIQTARDRRADRKRYAQGGTQRDARRVVVTGMGAVTCLGLDVPTTWAGLVAGRSGIGPISQFDASKLPVRIAGEVRGFDPLRFIDPKEARRMARCSHFAIAAAEEAATDSGLVIGKDVRSDRVGVVLGTALGGFEMSDSGMVELRTLGYRRVNPFALPAALPNAPGHHISTRFGAKGPLSTVVAACASGTQSIGDAAEMIRRGKIDAAFAGGVEATVIDGAIAAFSLMRVLSTHHNDDPARAAKPFDLNRDGFCFSEGCVVMMLEEYESARARGARIYAEVLGLGVSSDAHHIAIPDPEGAGVIRSMRWALDDADVDADEVDYINAHGSGTPTGDPIETMAIKTVLGERAYQVPVSSTKSMVGHAMGASGAIEALSTILTLREGVIPPTINLDTPDPACDLDYVPNVARRADVSIAMSNSIGLGGQNAAIVLGKV
ncbi:MAG: beta-ketoacyl-ACP synthase II [Thermoflexales bacterium]|nr:beta-ketoacyl-ACP synthase II [Thermoflexales bacterium]